MKLPKRGEKGFTLIELLIVVAILGVLAAVVIPNVGRFLGRGETEARRTEFHNVATSVIALMTDNNLSVISNAETSANGTAIKLMTNFPDSTSVGGSSDKLTDPNGNTYVPADKPGYLLYGHDIIADGTPNNLVNYVTITQTKYFYTSETDGTIRQWLDADASGSGTEYTY